MRFHWWHIKLLKLNKISNSQLINVRIASAPSLRGAITDKGIPINEYSRKQKLSIPNTKTLKKKISTMIQIFPKNIIHFSSLLLAHIEYNLTHFWWHGNNAIPLSWPKYKYVSSQEYAMRFLEHLSSFSKYSYPAALLFIAISILLWCQGKFLQKFSSPDTFVPTGSCPQLTSNLKIMRTSDSLLNSSCF